VIIYNGDLDVFGHISRELRRKKKLQYIHP